ncbi:MAG: hypothetical protein EHM93_05905 [Bacteroidales bacterium]|nr:MAG: hypothetical protein EHM93_05905 [Bacteroidales bacterium]
MEATFMTELEKEYGELLKTGKIQLIEKVKKLTSKQFSYSTPHYFIGNIRSRLALITFSSNKEYLCKGNAPIDFESYQYKSQKLGENFLDLENEKEFESIYSSDIRMFNYLKPFNTIRFDGDSITKNLKKLTTEKLELGLVPYPSPDFGEKDFMVNYNACKPFVERVLNGVIAYPRQYVVFIGSCFNNILEEYVEESESFRFLLTSPNYPNQKFITHFTRITLNYNHRRVIAGIAESFCDENLDSIMLEKYGQESVAIINRGFLLSNPLWKQS